MAATAPTFPATGSPHLDIQLRQLYGRIVTAERAIGIGEGTPSVPPVTDVLLQLVEATPVKLLQGFVRFDEGWAVSGGLQMRSGPVLLGNPVPPFVVLDVTVNVDVVFNYDLEFAIHFGVGTSADTEVNQRWYYAGSSRDASALPWLGSELLLNHPTGQIPERYANIGVVQTNVRPIVAGFFRAGPAPFSEWPADMKGQLQVLIVYADADTTGQSVPLSDLANHTLLSPKPLK
jgi:hypothetical protein